MRVLRSTMYGPELAPVTTVLRDSDVVDTLDSIRTSMPDSVPEGFIATEIFEMDEASIESATTAALGQMAPLHDDERNMAILFYWAAQHLRITSERGMLVMPAAAPLTEVQVRTVFEQIVKHPNYQHQLVQSTAQDGTVVVIKDGVIQ